MIGVGRQVRFPGLRHNLVRVGRQVRFPGQGYVGVRNRRQAGFPGRRKQGWSGTDQVSNWEVVQDGKTMSVSVSVNWIYTKLFGGGDRLKAFELTKKFPVQARCCDRRVWL